MIKKSVQYTLYVIIFLSGGTTTFFLNQWYVQKAVLTSSRHDSSKILHATKAKTPVSLKFDQSIQKDSVEIFHNDEALYSYVKKFGLRQTIRQWK
ncbi:MAG: hypothetical protein HY201_02125 [Nitrospirae bacterium]|nr:hypothetical protein [Candidatus Troglogloeales bacterium]